MLKQEQLKVTVNYPTADNQEKFENRIAKAVAKALFETLTPPQMDELIESYKKSIVKEHTNG